MAKTKPDSHLLYRKDTIKPKQRLCSRAGAVIDLLRFHTGHLRGEDLRRKKKEYLKEKGYREMDVVP